MLKIYVRKSSVQENPAGYDNARLEKLKKEVISILEKKDGEDLKKAIEAFAKDESRYSYLEKSVNGSWIEKAGYGVGTIRIWKGKKYKKVSTNPTRWVRVFDKHDRGAASSMGRYIAQVKRCKTMEELYQFCMKQRSLFQDDNGVDLPIMDKLRAEIEDKKGKIERGEPMDKVAKINADAKKESEKYDDDKAFEEYKKLASKEETTPEENSRIAELVKEHFKHSDKKWPGGAALRQESESKIKDNDYKNDHYNVTDGERTTLLWNVRKLQGDIESWNDRLAELNRDGEKIAGKKGELSDKESKKLIQIQKNRIFVMDELKKRNLELAEAKQKLADYDLRKEREEESEKKYNPDDPSNKSNPAYKKQFEYTLNRLKNGITAKEKTNIITTAYSMLANDDYSKEGKIVEQANLDAIEQFDKESEAEKHQNRSQAMMGNKNAYKGGYSDDEISKMKEIREKVNAYFEKKGEKVRPGDSKYNDKLIDMGKRSKDTEISDLCFALRKFDGKTPEEFQQNYEKRIVQGLHDNKDFTFEENIAGEIMQNSQYWAAHIDSRPAHGLIEMATLLNLAKENVTKVDDGYDKKGFGHAADVLKDMQKYSDHPEAFDDVIKGYEELNEKYNPDAGKEEPNEKIKESTKETPKETESEPDNYNNGPFGNTPISKVVEKYASDKQIKSTVNKVSSDDFASTDPNRLFMMGTFNEEGYKIATDGHVISMIKSDYPADDEGKIKGNKTFLKQQDKEIKKWKEVLKQNEDYLEQAKKDGKKLDPKFVNDKMRFAKGELEKAEKSKESGIIDAKFPNYKKVIPSLGNTSDLEPASGFEDFNKILKVAKVAAAYKKNTKANGVSVQVGDYKFNPDQLINAVAMAEKHGLKNVKFRSNSYNPALSPIEFSGDNGYVVIMPTTEDSYVFDSYTGNATSKYATEYSKDEELEKFLSGYSDEKSEQDAEKADRAKRSITDEAKSDILKNKPDGVTDRDYENLIDYTNDFYTKLGYDNSSERAKRQIKETVDNAIQQINNKDFGILESIMNSDNKVSRRVFQTLTAIPLGSNQSDAKKAWEKWVGHDAMQKYRDAENAKIQAEKDRIKAEKQAQIDADNEEYKGFLSNKTPAGAAKAKEILGKKGNFGGKIMSWQELADMFIAEGGKANTYEYLTSGGKKKPYYSVSGKDGRGYEVPKTVYDYAMHISNNPVKKSFAEIIMMDEYAHEDFEDESYSDYDASQPDLFNSTSYKVGAALDSIFGC